MVVVLINTCNIIVVIRFALTSFRIRLQLKYIFSGPKLSRIPITPNPTKKPKPRHICKTTLYLSKHKKSGDTFTIFDTMESLSPSGFDYERKDSTQRRLYSALINLTTEV